MVLCHGFVVSNTKSLAGNEVFSRWPAAPPPRSLFHNNALRLLSQHNTKTAEPGLRPCTCRQHATSAAVQAAHRKRTALTQWRTIGFATLTEQHLGGLAVISPPTPTPLLGYRNVWNICLGPQTVYVYVER